MLTWHESVDDFALVVQLSKIRTYQRHAGFGMTIYIYMGSALCGKNCAEELLDLFF